jgi:hypothetical protein
LRSEVLLGVVEPKGPRAVGEDSALNPNVEQGGHIAAELDGIVLGVLVDDGGSFALRRPAGNTIPAAHVFSA